MYYLPVVINERRTHICRISDIPQIHVPQFVLKNNKGSAPVLRIQHSAQLLNDKGYNGDLPLRGRWEIKRENMDPDTAIHQTIILRLNQDSNGSEPFRSIDQLHKTHAVPFFIQPLSKGNKTQDIVLFWKGTENAAANFELILEIKRRHDIEPLRYKINICVDEPTHIFNAVFDFGSEASQLAIDKRKKHQTKRLNLVDLIHDNFYPNPLDEKTYYVDFCQYDKNDDGLFLSNFFIKKKGGSEFNRLQKPFEYEQNALEILKTSKDYFNKSDTFAWMPNLKLMEMGNFQKFDVELNYERKGVKSKRVVRFSDVQEQFFEAIVNHFFYLLLKGISDEMIPSYMEEPDKLERPNKIRLTLLVPNIYDQKKVSDLIKMVNINGDKIIKRWNEDPAFMHDVPFDGLEVQTMSESDAAFLGLYEQHFKQVKLRKRSNYLIIDGGKATTDLSVIKVEDNAFSFSGSYRGGIAGAGNVLTYAFLENIAAVCVGTNTSARKQFIKKLLQADFNVLFKVIQAIEKLKKSYGNDRRLSKEEALNEVELESMGVRLYDPAEWERQNPSDLAKSLLILLEKCLIEQNLVLDDYCSIIEKTIDHLVDEIVKVINGLNEFSYTLVDGEYRKQLNYEAVILSGRAFLLDEFREKLTQKLIDQQVIKSPEDIIWEPSEAKKSCIEGPLYAPQGVNRNSDMVGFPVPSSLIENNHVNVNQAGHSKQLNGLEKVIHQLFNSQKSPSNNGQTPAYLLEDFLLKGLPIHSNDTVFVGDKLYRKEEPLTSNRADEKFNVIFTGEGFKLRSADNSVDLYHRHSEKNNHQDPLIWKSMFPNVPTSTSNSLDEIIVTPEVELYDHISSSREVI